ncbi:hypothetical protein [Polaromonas sp.]|uniref:hypothetical protein n=1 Tax=Polaromonas sp. TaxID=1869339 RepID=UPI00286BEC0E|nr:hypothetical protein [Polaromonas sp.]
MQFTSRVAAVNGSSKRPPAAEVAPDSAANAAPQAAAQATTDYTLVSQIGAELSAPINAMQQIVHDFTQTRQISRRQMKELNAAIEAASQIARQTQQIGRLAEGRLRQSHERIRLDELLHEVLRELSPKLEARGIEVRYNIKPVEIIVDPGLLSGLVDAALNWGCAHGQHLMISLSIKNWPEHGMLVIKATAPLAPDDPARQADTINGQLLSHTAQTMGVTLQQELSASGEAKLELEFARTVRVLEGLTTLEIDASGDSSFHNGTKPLAGLRILVISNDPLVRGEVDEASRMLGLNADSVPTVLRARRYMELDMPHLIIIDERLHDNEFDLLVNDVKNIEPNIGLLEIADNPNTFEVSSWMGDNMTRVSREVLRAQLPSVLTLELARAL